MPRPGTPVPHLTSALFTLLLAAASLPAQAPNLSHTPPPIPPRVQSARRFLSRRNPPHPHSATPPTPNASSPVWFPAGPTAVQTPTAGLVSGRIAAIAFDPADSTGNHLYVGTTGGGLWTSQNAASSTPAAVAFLPATDNTAALNGIPETGISVGAVTVQPGATGVVLVGLGDPNDALDSYYGAGILRSTDSGKTWSLIPQTVDQETGLSQQDYSFLGEGFSAFAWSTVNTQLVVASVSQAYESTLVNAGTTASSYEGLYYSSDAGATWHLATITDLNGQDVQGPADPFAYPDGNAATSVVWNPVRQLFLAAIRYHGYYQSTDGIHFTQIPFASQPGTGFTALHCPTLAGSIGVAGCPIFRGTLAVNPQSGDTFAWSVDAFNQGQGIWQDQCSIQAGTCTGQTLNFATQIDTAALESPGTDAVIQNGDYNLTLAAVPSAQDTLLFAGDNDLWRCSLANSCVWRNTTNTTTCMSAKVGEYQHALAWNPNNPQLLFLGNDSGLWRTTDALAQTGSVCASTDATHVQNLNSSLGSLAEIESLGQAATNTNVQLVGLGANGFAGTPAATTAPWNQILSGEGGPVAVDPSAHSNSWYANNAAGVAILHCNVPAGSNCTPAAFGTTPLIGESQVQNDGLAMPYPAEFKLDPYDATQILIGTCRLWRGPISGLGWTAANALSPILDGTNASGPCNGNALIRSIAALNIAGGGEILYVGMAGQQDGGGIVPGHVFTATIDAAGTLAAPWTDIALSPVLDNALAFNPFGLDVSSLYIDPHDNTGSTLYATISGFSSTTEPLQQLYRTTDAGQHWAALTSNLPNAPANAVAVDPQDPNTAYVATDAGVYLTRAIATCPTTPCWAPYGTGLPLAPVTQLIAAPANANGPGLTAGTYGRGLWQIPLVTAGAIDTTASISPSALTFPATTVGVASATQSLTLKNTGTPALLVTGITANAPDYTETDTCQGQSIPKNTTCALKITFTPTQAGARPASLAIAANLPGGQLLVPLSGTGLATASLTLTPTSVPFGSQQVGTASAAQSLNLQNTGGSSVSLASIAVTAPFTKTASTCTGTLTPATGCAISVAFAPTQAGAATGTLTVKDSVGSQSAVLLGTGITGPTDTLSATSLAFPATVLGQSAAPLAVNLTNSGGLPLNSIGTSISSSFPGDFTALSNCGTQLAPASSCGIAVTFRPSAAKPETATLTISDALHSQSVALTGSGLKPAVLAISKPSLAFPSLQINTTSPAQTLTLSNTGGSPMAAPTFSINAATANSANSFAIAATTCGQTPTLAAGATCTVSLTFTPIAPGSVTATLTAATSTQGVASISATLSGTGLTPPTLAVSPAVLNLGTVVLGNSTALFTVQVSNTGQIAMQGPTFAVTGPQAADFALSVPTDSVHPACTAALAPAATCDIQITFSPTLVGLETATLTATGANAIPPTATVSLSGTGAPLILLEASPTALAYPATAVGTQSSPLTLTLSNLGRQTANSLKLALTGPYQQSATTCKATLAAKSSCTVSLVFAPTASGDQPGTLTASVTNLGVSPLAIPLDGTGLAVGGILPTPTQLTFGSTVLKTSSVAQTVTIANSGQAPLTGISLKLAGEDPSDFALTANACAALPSATLAAAATCTTGILFTPAIAGQRTATLTVSTTSTGVAPAVVSLTGQGIPAGALTATPAVASFGTVLLGQTSAAQTVTLTNTGATTLAALTLQVAGDYGLPTTACGTQLASAASCSFNVNFAPTQVGTRIGSVTVNSSNPGFTPFVVALTGQGLASAQLVVTPTQLNFASVPVGSNSAPLQLTATNPGTGTLTGLSFIAAAPFSVGTGTCGPLLAAASQCTVPVVFAPTIAGPQSGSVLVSSTSLGVTPTSVSLTGTGLLPPSLSLSPPSLSFPGTTIASASPTQTLTVTNPGGLSLAGLTLALTGTALKDYAFTSTCAAILPAAASCTVTLTFTPSIAGGRSAFLTASSTTAGVAPASASLTGTGLTPAVLALTPTQLTFPATLITALSPTQSLTLANSGQSTIPDLQIFPTANFQLDPVRTNCTATLPGASSCTIGVVFAPSTPGPLTGSLSASSAKANVTTSAALSGTGALPPGLSTQPAALVQFGTTGVAQPSQPVTVTLTNTGTLSPLTGLHLSLDPTGTANGFALNANTCNGIASLAPLATCTVNVTFTPAIAGPLSGTLLLSSTNGSGQSSLALAGIGFDFHFVVTGSSKATVIQGQTATYTLAITPLGAPSGSFAFACGTLPANAHCTFSQLPGLPANTTGNLQLSLATGAPTQSAGYLRTGTLLACALIAIPCIRTRRIRLRLGLLLLALPLSIACLSSCVAAGVSAGQLHLGGGTPPGTYPVTISATANGITRTQTVTLTVN